MTLEHQNLELTPYYRIIHSISPNNCKNFSLNGKLVLASAISVIEAIKHLALSVFKAERKQENAQLSKVYLYSAKESLRAIWNLNEACQKVSLFVFKKTILSVCAEPQNYAGGDEFKVLSENFKALNPSRKEEALQFVLNSSQNVGSDRSMAETLFKLSQSDYIDLGSYLPYPTHTLKAVLPKEKDKLDPELFKKYQGVLEQFFKLKKMSTAFGKILIQTLSLFTGNQLNSGLVKTCQDAIRAIAFKFQSEQSRIFVCEREDSPHEVKIAEWNSLRWYSKGFPELFESDEFAQVFKKLQVSALRSHGSSKPEPKSDSTRYWISKDEKKIKEELNQLLWLIDFESRHSQKSSISATRDEFSRIFALMKQNNKVDELWSLCRRVLNGSPALQNDRELMRQWIEFIVLETYYFSCAEDIILAAIRKWPGFLGDALLEKILEASRSDKFLIELVKHSGNKSYLEFISCLELIPRNRFYSSERQTWYNEASMDLKIQKGIESLAVQFNQWVSGEFDPLGYHRGFDDHYSDDQRRGLYEQMKKIPIFSGCELAWFRVGTAFKDEEMINQGFKALFSAHGGSFLTLTDSSEDHQTIVGILKNHSEIARNPVFIKHALYKSGIDLFRQVFINLDKAEAIPLCLGFDYLRASERMRQFDPNYAINEEMVERMSKALLSNLTNFVPGNYYEAETLIRMLNRFPGLILNQSAKDWAEKHVTHNSFKKELADAILARVKAQEAAAAAAVPLD